MTLRYVWRILAERRAGLALAAIGLALAMASTLSVIRAAGLIVDGTPKGTTIRHPRTVFMHSSGMEIDFFLGPRQVLGLQQALGASADVLASSGVRAMAAEVDGQVRELAIDVVSPNFFQALGVRTSPPLEGWMRETHTAVVSSRLVRQLGGQPSKIRVAGKLLEVIGTAEDFTGLWDKHTDVWVDWRLGNDLLFPTARKGVVEDQPWFYWTLLIPRNPAEFEVRLQHALRDSSLTEAPFDSFRVVPGITNHPDLRADADDTVHLFGLLAAIALLVCAVQCATWSATTRLSKGEHEWTMLCLGMPRRVQAAIAAMLTFAPVLLGSLLALPLESLFQRILLADPAVDLLLTYGAEVELHFPWQAWWLLGGSVAVFAWVAAAGATRLAGLGFSSRALKFEFARSRMAFRALVVAMSFLAAIGLIVGSWGVQGLAALRSMVAGVQENVFVAELACLSSDGQRAFLSPEDRKQLMEHVAIAFPEADASGIVSARPFSDGRTGLTAFSREAGGAAALKLQVVEVDGDAIESLLGDAARPAPNSFDLVLDTRAAVRLAAIAKRDDVIGLSLYDGAGLAYTIRGIVEHVPYATSTGSTVGAGYVAMGESTPVLHLVIRGSLTERRISTLDLSLGDRRVEVREPRRLGDLATRMQARFGARIAFALATALVCASVALVAVLAVVLLEVRRELRALAIRAALGASTPAMVRVALKSILWSVGLGTAMAIAACGFLAGPAQGEWFGSGRNSLLAVWLVAPLLVLLCAACGAWLVHLELSRRPLRKLLQAA